MNIHQLSVNYIQEHDRILVRINTTSGEELRLWLTRRLTLGFMPMLNKIVTEWVAKQEALKSTHISPTAAADAQTQQMLHEFKRVESLQQSDFQTPYKAAQSLPLGAEPLVVTEIQITPLANGQLQISFSEKLPLDDGQPNPHPRGFRVALEQKLVHGFVHLLDKALALSQWIMPNPLQAAASAALPGEKSSEPESGDDGNFGGQQRPKYLN